MDDFYFGVSDDEKERERRIAKELKKTLWWKKKKADGICYYCRDKFLSEELTMDHIIPLSRGGKSIKANIVPSCKKCNIEKKNKLAFEFTPEKNQNDFQTDNSNEHN